ncbi:MAG: hypothetical protein J2P18_00155 [Nocardia sp.]|nr:hypothetical protein [Nocardia sp.]
MLKADLDQINKLADTIDDVAKQIDAIGIRAGGDAISAALPGCSIGAECAQLGEFTEGAWLRVSQRLTSVSASVRNTANLFALTDDKFAEQLHRLDFRTQGGH